MPLQTHLGVNSLAITDKPNSRNRCETKRNRLRHSTHSNRLPRTPPTNTRPLDAAVSTIRESDEEFGSIGDVWYGSRIYIGPVAPWVAHSNASELGTKNEPANKERGQHAFSQEKGKTQKRTIAPRRKKQALASTGLTMTDAQMLQIMNPSYPFKSCTNKSSKYFYTHQTCSPNDC